MVMSAQHPGLLRHRTSRGRKAAALVFVAHGVQCFKATCDHSRCLAVKSEQKPVTHLLDAARVPTLIIVGHSGSGKSTLATILSERTGLPIVEIGQYVIAEAKATNPRLSPLEYA